MNPSCKTCGAKLLRWSWWEHPLETYKYWYCLECDKAGRAPFIFFISNYDWTTREREWLDKALEKFFNDMRPGVLVRISDIFDD